MMANLFGRLFVHNNENVAELNEWTSAEMAAFLATSVEGSAANVIASMETSKRRDYAALVDVLETRFGTAVQKELNRVKLRSSLNGG